MYKMYVQTLCLMYKIQEENVYKDFYPEKKLFGISSCQKDSKQYNKESDFVVNKMKDEMFYRIEI